MAERLREKFSLEQLEKEVTCGICQDHYTDPKILPCLHYYCKQCVLRLALRTGTGEPFHCPECRGKVTLPEEGVEGLKSAFFIGRLKSIWEGLQSMQVKANVCCSMCSPAKASTFCVQCAKFICSTCNTAHQGHEVVSAQNRKQEKEEANGIADATPIEIEKCKLHSEELKLYCFDCDTLVCRDCTIVDHKDHKFQFSTVAAPDTKEKLMTKLEPLKQVGDKLSQAVDDVKLAREEVEAQGVGVAHTINFSFDELVQIVEQRRKELLVEAKRKVQQKVDKLTVQEKTLSLANAEVQSVVDYTERCVEHGTDNEIMSMHSKIRDQIGIVHNRHNPLQGIEPVKKSDMGVEVKCSDQLNQICQTEANMTQLPVDLARYTVIGEGARKAVVNQTAEFILIANTLANGKPTGPQGTKITCVIESLFNNHVIQCDVYEMPESGCYRISYTPTYRGRHELTILVDKSPIPNCPFSIYVDILPSQLSEHVSVIYDVDRISDIAINSTGTTVIGKQTGDPIVFYKDQKNVGSVSRNHLKLGNYVVIGVDVDSEDFVYFTVYHSNILVKLDREGNLVLKARSKQNSGNLGVAVIGEEVAVCPRHRNGTIMVYDRNFKFKREIFGNDMGEFRDICPDSEGNLFVTDWTMNYIRVFSPGGNALRSFTFLSWDTDASLVKLRGICVSRELVFVCVKGKNPLDNGIFIFTPKGDHVSTIGGGIGLKVELVGPFGVHVDQDGFVYVADTSLLQVF